MANSDGLCVYTGAPPIFLSWRERLSWDILQECLSISPVDSLRLPTISLIDFVTQVRMLRETLGVERFFEVYARIVQTLPEIRNDIERRRKSNPDNK